MQKRNYIPFGFFTIFFVVYTVQNADAGGGKAAPFTITSIRDMGYGGRHAAYTNGIFSLLVNPAALSSVHETSIFGLEGGINSNLDEIMDFFNIAGKKPLDDSKIMSYIEKGLSDTPPFFNFNGPLMIGYTGKSIGIGLFNRLWMSSQINYDNGFAVYNVYMNKDFFANIGISFNIIDVLDSELDIGIGAQLFFRHVNNLLEQKVLLSQDPLSKQLESGSASGKNLFGGGLNFGLMYTLKNRLSFGITVNDAPSTAVTSGIGVFLFVPAISFGMAYKVVYNSLLVCTIMADCRDILENVSFTTDEAAGIRDALLNVSAGMEIEISKMYMIRFGMYDLLPSFGIGCNMGKYKINAAFYGKEYGLSGGTYSTYNISVGFQQAR
jgi:hypothetical protein